MFVFFDGEGFEASLIQVPRSFGVMVCVPAHGVRVGEPAEEASPDALSWADDEMPMAGHPAVGKNRQFLSLKRFSDHTLESVVIFRLFQQRQPGNGSIEYVKTGSGGTAARTTWHAFMPNKPAPRPLASAMPNKPAPHKQ